jgi:hypothetical protein
MRSFLEPFDAIVLGAISIEPLLKTYPPLLETGFSSLEGTMPHITTKPSIFGSKMHLARDSNWNLPDEKWLKFRT